jgi:hypothetical protein
MKKWIQYMGYGVGGMLLFSGCVPRIPTAPLAEQNKTVHRVMWEDTSTVEKNYSLKPEPYSLDSQEKDPELLGPQSTLKKSLSSSKMMESPQIQRPENGASTDGAFLARDKQSPSPSSQPTMTRSRCIELIGRSDFEKYTRQFGSERAALRKCIILERVQQK